MHSASLRARAIALTFALALGAASDAAASGAGSFSLTDGYRYESANGQIKLHLGGVYAGEYVDYDSRNESDSQLRSAIINPIIEGSLGEQVSFRIVPDLEGTRTRFNLTEAWTGIELLPRVKLTGGLIRMPMGFESWFQDYQLSLIGWAFPTYLDSRTDLALALTGEMPGGWLSGQVGYGFGQGFDAVGDKQEGDQFSVRAVVFPLLFGRDPQAPDPPAWWQGLFGGVAWFRTDDYKSTLKVDTPLDTQIFGVSRFEADSSDFFHYTVGLDAGPVRLVYEHTDGGYSDVKGTPGEQDLDQVSAWQASVTWMITGERYDTKAFRQVSSQGDFPARPFGSGDGYGAFEFGFRYSNYDIDRDFFVFGFTSESLSSQEARTMSWVLNWYPTKNFRFGAEFVRTLADDDPASLGGQGRDSSWVLRAQYQF